MDFKPPKNSDKYQWTRHAVFKLRQYGLSSQRITRVIRAPKRIEKGIVKNTIAVMQPSSVHKKNGKETWSQEIWAMYQLRKGGAISKSQFPISKQNLNSKSQIKPRTQLLKKINILNSRFLIHNSANRQIRIISAWRYPGVSPKNNPIPEEILDEIRNNE
jgi:hypothetical protein